MLLKHYVYTKICSILFLKLHWQISVTPPKSLFLKIPEVFKTSKNSTFLCIKDQSDQITFSSKSLYLFSPSPALLPNYDVFGRDEGRTPGVYFKSIYSQHLRQYRHPVAQLWQDMYTGQQWHRKMLEDHFTDNSKSIVSNCVGEENVKSLKVFLPRKPHGQKI